jgi:RimJ/RimL family protein N-acetyltransferase
MVEFPDRVRVPKRLISELQENRMLKSDRVALTPLTQDDSPLLWQWINDREQVLFNSSYKPVSELQQQEWFEGLQHKDDLAIFGIRLLETNQLIGSCQLHSINTINRSAELQIRLGNPADRGKGYGTEAVRLLLQFAFADLNLHRVYLHVFASNTRARQAYEKAGFVAEGTLRKAVHVNGEYVDVVVMGVLREDHVGE